MRAGEVVCLIVIGLAGGGCRTPVTLLRPGTPAPTYAATTILSPVEPQSIVPDLSKLARTGPAAASYNYRGLDEASTQCLAVMHSSIGNLLDQENAASSVLGVVRHHGTVNAAGDDLIREVRRLAALDARNRSAQEALDRYYQLADAEGKRELFTAGIASFDTFRTEAARLRGLGLPVPKEDELERQRSSLAAELTRIDAGIGLLNHDLIARLGVKLDAGERLWPTAVLPVTRDLPDVEASVKVALAQRPDLQLIRTMHDRLSPETLPSVREAMQTLSGLVGSKPMLPNSLLPNLFQKPKGPTPQEREEIESRRRQLMELLTTREAETAAQVRTSIGQMAAAAERTALLQTRVESLTTKLAAANAAKHTADIPTVETDLYKAQAEVLAAAVEWQQWRVKLKAAQGLFSTECQAGETPRNSASCTGLVPVKVRTLHFARSVQ